MAWHQFTTRFGLGDMFYMPRCYKRQQLEAVTVGDDPLFKRVTYFEAVVKKRMVCRIKIECVKDGPYQRSSTQYQCLEEHEMDGSFPGLGHWFKEEELLRYPRLEDEAWEIANYHMKNKQEYFGPNGNDLS